MIANIRMRCSDRFMDITSLLKVGREPTVAKEQVPRPKKMNAAWGCWSPDPSAKNRDGANHGLIQPGWRLIHQTTDAFFCQLPDGALQI
jgi:hypothetical protein